MAGLMNRGRDTRAGAHGGGAAFRPQMPYHMVWLATNACNARCVHCSTGAAKRRPGELSTAEARAMLENLTEAGVFDLAVSGGEPLTRDDIFDVLAYAARLGFRFGVGSNGSPVNAEVVRRLQEVGLDRLQISLDGLEATHDLARRWSGLFQKSVQAIETAVHAGLRVHVCFTVHRLNHLELAAAIDFCAQLGVRRFNMSRFVPTGRGAKSLDLTPLEWRDVVVVYDAKRQEYAQQLEFTTHLAQLILGDNTLDCMSGFIGCQAGIGQGCIGPEGQVSPCVMLPVTVGNIRLAPLREIWSTSPVIQSLQDRANLKGACHDCYFRAKCGGCRAVAYAYTRDYLAADSRCWRSCQSEIN